MMIIIMTAYDYIMNVLIIMQELQDFFTKQLIMPMQEQIPQRSKNEAIRSEEAINL